MTYCTERILLLLGLLGASDDLWAASGDAGDTESPPSDCYYTTAFAAAALVEQARSSVAQADLAISDSFSSVCAGPGDDSTIDGSEFAM